MNRNINKIVEQYLETADWADGQDLQAVEGFVYSTIAKELAYRDCLQFLEKAGSLLTDEWDDSQIGHDFWLTRNHHGTGFWDRNLPNGEELTVIANSFKSMSLYVDCNKEIQFE